MMKRAFARIYIVLSAGFLFALISMPQIEAEPRVPVIVALGDSLTAGFGLPQDAAFPAQLEAALKARGHEVSVANAGVSGDTAAAALKRIDWALPDAADAVIVELGANDALQGLPPAETKAVLAKIIEALQAKDLPILLAGMEAPRNLGQDYVAEFAAIFPALAERYNVLLYPFFLDGVALDDGLMQADGIHPNAKG
ncbi:MAG: arylesterase, partial [Methyloceanibacter sp.]